MTIIHESDVPEIEQPGRSMRWLVHPDALRAANLSFCVIRVQPGETVRPAHSHPHSEELIYILSGHGKVMIEGEVGEVRTGTAVLASGITSIAGFGVLALSGITMLRDFGLVTVVDLTAALIWVLLVLPALLFLLERR